MGKKIAEHLLRKKKIYIYSEICQSVMRKKSQNSPVDCGENVTFIDRLKINNFCQLVVEKKSWYSPFKEKNPIKFTYW